MTDSDHKTPPEWAQRLLAYFLKDELAEEVLGDLDEKFLLELEKQSAWRAKLNYWYQVINYLRPFAMKKSKNSIQVPMLTHYLKVSWRSILRNKSLSAIKIGGFAMGIASCLMIALFIGHELSYDAEYVDQSQVFRMTNQWTEGGESGRWTNLQGPLKEVIEDNIPEVELVSRVVFWSWGNAGANLVRTPDDVNNLDEKGFIYSDPELLSILEIPMVYGSQEFALTAPNSIVISESVAQKHFGLVDPIGRDLILNDDPNTIYTIGGVMEDFPTNSHMQADFIMTLTGRKNGPGTSGWCCTNYVFYTKIQESVDKQVVENKLLSIRDSYVIDQLKTVGAPGLEEMRAHHSYYLQPVSDIYLNTAAVSDDLEHGSRELVWIFAAIAVVILLLASINFINISTAKSVGKAKEVGLRKVMGSHRSALIWQYLSESIVYSVLAIVFATMFTFLFMPVFNQISGKSLQIPWLSWWFIPSLLLVSLVIGLVSGLYPALYLTRFQPAQILRGKITFGRGASIMRSGLVVFQFAVTIVLLIAAIVTHQQFQLIMNKSLGYEKDQVVTIHGLNTLDSAKKALMKAEMLSIPTVTSATIGDFLPVAGSAIHNRNYWLSTQRKMTDGFEAARWTVDEDYLDTYGMTLVEGVNFTGARSDEQSIIINETMRGELGLQEAVGQQVIDMFDEKYRIIGVVKDFHFRSVFATVEPLAMVYGRGKSVLSIKVSGDDMMQSMAAVGSLWDSLRPNQPFRYTFLDQSYQRMYDSLIRAKSIFLIFAFLSIVIACLGLLALSAYVVEQRSKEVSIRKVLGASVTSIFTLLSFDFIKLVVIAMIFGMPLGWLMMDAFLGDVANRVDLSWYLFALAGAIGLIIALATISIETIKAAIVNPASRLSLNELVG
ncbi:ABC transporter permease [Marinoscillum sp.]|uniref:ABC transporter permease n=1 Tax=Marinoscillum sp. TaxID=2024838 RepID=UPI003BAD8098